MSKGKWYSAECISKDKPPVREDSSSEYVIYLRKDFKFIPERTMDDGTVEPGKWTYLETTIPKDAAELLEMTERNSTDIVDIENAICEFSMRGNV